MCGHILVFRQCIWISLLTYSKGKVLYDTLLVIVVVGIVATSRSLTTSTSSLRRICRKSSKWKDHYTRIMTHAYMPASTFLRQLVTRKLYRRSWLLIHVRLMRIMFQLLNILQVQSTFFFSCLALSVDLDEFVHCAHHSRYQQHYQQQQHICVECYHFAVMYGSY